MRPWKLPANSPRAVTPTPPHCIPLQASVGTSLGWPQQSLLGHPIPHPDTKVGAGQPFLVLLQCHHLCSQPVLPPHSWVWACLHAVTAGERNYERTYWTHMSPFAVLAGAHLGKVSPALEEIHSVLVCAKYCALHVLRLPDEMGITNFYLYFIDGGNGDSERLSHLVQGHRAAN